MGIRVRDNTDTELDFLRKMGSHREQKHKPLPLLKGYLLAAKNKVEWGRVEKAVVIAEAERLVAKLEGK